MKALSDNKNIQVRDKVEHQIFYKFTGLIGKQIFDRLRTQVDAQIVGRAWWYANKQVLEAVEDAVIYGIYEQICGQIDATLAAVSPMKSISSMSFEQVREYADSQVWRRALTSIRGPVLDQLFQLVVNSHGNARVNRQVDAIFRTQVFKQIEGCIAGQASEASEAWWKKYDGDL